MSGLERVGSIIPRWLEQFGDRRAAEPQKQRPAGEPLLTMASRPPGSPKAPAGTPHTKEAA